VSCKRWKAASTGVEPLRELHAAAERREAHESVYITAGQLTDNARQFAREKGIRVMEGEGLAQLLKRR
jgi:restriction system protein